MNAKVIENTLLKLAELNQLEINYFNLKDKYNPDLTFQAGAIDSFFNHFQQKALKVRISLVEHYVNADELKSLIDNIHHPLILFVNRNGDLSPLLVHDGGDGRDRSLEITAYGEQPSISPLARLSELYSLQNQADPERNGKYLIYTAYPIEELISDNLDDNPETYINTPFKRLMNLLKVEKKDIGYIYIYAIVVGIINLSLPLGVQAIIGLISGGMVFSSVVILIALVILGVLIGGGLQIMQISMVEILQRRVYAKAAFEFAYRVPRFRKDSLRSYNPVELMNRFFDVLNVQKGLPKLLIDLLAAALQIIFGLLLLAFYHPFFVFFGIILLGLLGLIFYLTGSKGLESNMVESKYKYKLVNWFQEMARSVVVFKMAGNSNLPMKKTDELVNSYLYYRKQHFSVLIQQYGYILGFKTIITGGLLVLGTILVVGRQITLGQFVASEIVIITIVGAVEKIIINMSVIYDLLTGVEKVGQVTDVPLERESGLKLRPEDCDQGLTLEVKNLSYTYPDGRYPAINGLNLTIKPGQRICLAGQRGSGKQTLVRILLGLIDDYEGIVTFNGISQRDINLPDMRALIGENLLNTSLFDGSILDNITLGRNYIPMQDIVQAMQNLQLSDTINSLPDGLATVVMDSQTNLSQSAKYKVSLARAIVGKPRLLILNDTHQIFEKDEKLQLLSYLHRPEHGWSILYISNDPLVIAACDTVLGMEAGRLVPYRPS